MAPTTESELRVALVELSAPNGPTPDEAEFAERARAALEAVLAEPWFLESVRATAFEPTMRIAPDRTEEVPNADEVAAIILAGGEGDETVPNKRLDLRVEIANLPPGIEARTLPRAAKLTVDTVFFARCMSEDKPGALAAVLMHEWLHMAGFMHETLQGDPADVPYEVEHIVARIAHDLGFGVFDLPAPERGAVRRRGIPAEATESATSDQRWAASPAAVGRTSGDDGEAPARLLKQQPARPATRPGAC